MANTSINQARIKKVWELGHFRNPAYEEACEVTADDVYSGAVDIKSKAAKEAIKSWQTMHMEAVSAKIAAFHPERPTAIVNIDGEFGPACDDVARSPRCAVPDHGHYLFRDGRVAFYDSIVDLRKADPVADSSPVDGEFAEANWPTSCRNQITFAYSVRHFMRSNLSIAQTRECFARAFWNLHSTVELDIDFDDSLIGEGKNHREAMIWAEMANFSGSKLAHSYLAQNRCSAHLEQMYGSNKRWRSLSGGSGVDFTTTATHEIMHALGGRHVSSSGATLYYAITSTSSARRGALVNADFRELERQGYRRRATPLPGPDKPDNPDNPTPNPGQEITITLTEPLRAGIHKFTTGSGGGGTPGWNV